jgi:hypothetical protein
MARADLPIAIDRARHHELAGRYRHVWWRRIALMVLAAIPVLALFDVFGQRTVLAGADTSVVSLVVNSPAHVRGGLIVTTEIVITPHQQLQDARLFLGSGWFEGITLNGITPQPSTFTAQGRWQIWDFGKIAAGHQFQVWISWQVNPTSAGTRSQDVALYNKGTHLVNIHRAITIFP